MEFETLNKAISAALFNCYKQTIVVVKRNEKFWTIIETDIKLTDEILGHATFTPTK